MPKGPSDPVLSSSSTAARERRSRSVIMPIKSAPALASSSSAAAGSSLKSKQLSRLLSLRLSYAKYKVEKGWSSSSLSEVELLSSTSTPRRRLSLASPQVTLNRPATAPLLPAAPVATAEEGDSSEDLDQMQVQPSVDTNLQSAATDLVPRPQTTVTAFGHSASSSRSSLSTASELPKFMPMSSTSSSSATSFGSSLRSAGPLYSSYASSVDLQPPYPQSQFPYLQSSDSSQHLGPSATTDHARRSSYHPGFVPTAPPMMNSYSEPGFSPMPMTNPPTSMQTDSGRSHRHGGQYIRPDAWSDRYDWSQQRQLPPVGEYTPFQSYVAPSPNLLSQSVNDHTSTPRRRLLSSASGSVGPGSPVVPQQHPTPTSFASAADPQADNNMYALSASTSTPHDFHQHPLQQQHPQQHTFSSHPPATASPFVSPAPGAPRFDATPASAQTPNSMWQYTHQNTTPVSSHVVQRDDPNTTPNSSLLPPADIC